MSVIHRLIQVCKFTAYMLGMVFSIAGGALVAIPLYVFFARNPFKLADWFADKSLEVLS